LRATYRLALLLCVLLGTGACGGDGDPQEPATPEPTTDGVALEEGDPARGKAIFLAAGCGGCHTFTPAGPAGSSRNVGPNLEEAAKLYPPEFLLESIVDPRAYLEKGEGGSIGGTREYGDTCRPTVRASRGRKR
jgi:mono/diheme cytochrome c family protein